MRQRHFPHMRQLQLAVQLILCFCFRFLQCRLVRQDWLLDSCLFPYRFLNFSSELYYLHFLKFHNDLFQSRDKKKKETKKERKRETTMGWGVVESDVNKFPPGTVNLVNKPDGN